jgi:AraC-like DNA-binding protein
VSRRPVSNDADGAAGSARQGALRRVDKLAAALDVPVRRLQRLFADYVGASPKWVMRRARLHEAAERAERGGHVDWAGLASDLGYADQAHLTRDFTATIGVPPSRYAGVS